MASMTVDLPCLILVSALSLPSLAASYLVFNPLVILTNQRKQYTISIYTVSVKLCDPEEIGMWHILTVNTENVDYVSRRY